MMLPLDLNRRPVARRLRRDAGRAIFSPPPTAPGPWRGRTAARSPRRQFGPCHVPLLRDPDRSLPGRRARRSAARPVRLPLLLLQAGPALARADVGADRGDLDRRDLLPELHGHAGRLAGQRRARDLLRRARLGPRGRGAPGGGRVPAARAGPGADRPSDDLRQLSDDRRAGSRIATSSARACCSSRTSSPAASRRRSCRPRSRAARR